MLSGTNIYFPLLQSVVHLFYYNTPTCYRANRHPLPLLPLPVLPIPTDPHIPSARHPAPCLSRRNGQELKDTHMATLHRLTQETSAPWSALL